jgi:hypothetical protein
MANERVFFSRPNQTFNAKIVGLLPSTTFNLYFDGVKVSANNIKNWGEGKKFGEGIVSDTYGNLHIVFQYVGNSAEVNNGEVTSLTQISEVLGGAGAEKKVVVVDNIISTATLPDNYQDICRSYAEMVIDVAYKDITSGDIKIIDENPIITVPPSGKKAVIK